MAAVYTVDASVFLNAFNPREDGHQDSHRFLARLRQEARPIMVPTLLLPEVAATVARGRQDAVLARRFARTIRRLPHLILVPLDDALAEAGIDVAADYRLRGSDAVYAAVALRFSSILVTRDKEQHERVSRVLPTRYPHQALDEMT